MSPRLPLASRDDLLEELELIEQTRARHNAKTIVDLTRWQNYADGLDEWEHDLRAQLAGLPERVGAPLPAAAGVVSR